ncbi:MAG: thioredoxin family protein, partial [Cyclobacteriaceae bacterium]|nr:thioredoxin family protein [Cyclobacteriaceae bacterium]
PSILEGENELNDESFFGYLVFAFVLGIVSLITPCVFPMVPMTVTFFLRDNQSRRQGIRNALIFGASIITIYTLAGTLFAILLGAEGLNALATHWAPNLFVFVIFVVFALSFLGMFEITAPHQLVNKADQQAEKGGLIGIFFMAATLVLVSFSCTIPIVGNVVVLSAGGQVIKPVLAMFSYSLAFAIPFTLFAIFPEWMKGLPKSGGWLNAVKVTLGFLELALALKFLSIADQAYHWGILDRDVNIVLWIVIFGLLGLYLLGKIRLPHDSPVEKISVPRLLLAITVFSFVVYLVPGLWGAPLKALAGYLPPQHTHDFDLVAMTRNARENAICDEPRYAEFLHLPHGLKGYFDYAQALACARAQDKPLFIDFTGHGCTNCREMEAVVWSDPAVLERLKNDFVIVALYVDDKTLLPESEWVTSTYDGKVKKTLGKKNADLQITRLNNNAQPFYVLVGKDERVLAWPYGYDRNVEKFVDFLERGKKKYKELYQ